MLFGKKNVRAGQGRTQASGAGALKSHRTHLLIKRVIFTAITAGIILFIFANSSETAAVSGGKSAAITAFVNDAFEKIGMRIAATEHHIRKLAHFSEYAVLGFFAMLTLRTYTRRCVAHISWPLLLCILIAVLDESLQLGVDGRSGQVSDVIIDFCGGMAGSLCGLVPVRWKRG